MLLLPLLFWFLLLLLIAVLLQMLLLLLHVMLVVFMFLFNFLHHADASSTDMDPLASGRSPHTLAGTVHCWQMRMFSGKEVGTTRIWAEPAIPGRHRPSLANAHCFWEAIGYKKDGALN